MRLAVVLACFVVSGLAEKPRPCMSPPLLTGEFSVYSQDERIGFLGKYLYDALGQRVRLFEMGKFENRTFTADVLLHFREAALYEIDDTKRTCKKSPLKADFHPLRIPKNASLLGQAVVGSSSAPGQGLLVNTWAGDLPDQSGQYMSVITEFGCIPVTTNYKTKEYGWVGTNYFNNVIGITNPDLLEPPAFCADAVMDVEAERRDYLSLLEKKN
ncbi:hypothetical protein OJAV_G00178420 [Oryzias javanicus]|uniref:Ependymin-like 1 n=1 Tax=Oryzias javanicus TaxID=123683 RepID=A0A3S2U0Y2_ORYJA|nr:hypothetical protein OJAV_G00178420 [Oryzias javanicus]